MRKILKCYHAKQKKGGAKDSRKNAGAKPHTGLKGRTGCSRLATVSTIVPMSKAQTNTVS